MSSARELATPPAAVLEAWSVSEYRSEKITSGHINLTWKLSEANSPQALILQRDAINRYPDGSYSVFVVVEETGVLVARERRVRIGRSASEVEVLEGL